MLIISHYDSGKYPKVISEIDQHLDLIINNDYLLIELYLISCYESDKPRKFAKMLEKVNAIEDMDLINKLMVKFLKDNNEKFLKIISKIYKNNKIISFEIELLTLEYQIRGIYFKENSDSQKIANSIKYVLNNDLFLRSKKYKNLLESLRLRVRKLYRNKEYEKILIWLDEVVFNKENFDICLYFLFSLRQSQDNDTILEKCIYLFKLIDNPKNIESIIDLLYTIGKNKEIILLIEGVNEEKISIKTSLIYARSLRKSGDESGAQKVINDIKSEIENKVLEDELDISIIIEDLTNLIWIGEIEITEFLLHKLLKRKDITNARINEIGADKIIKLFRTVLDLQKRERLKDSLVISRLLVKESKYEESLRLLNPYILHEIINSADLFDLYIISAKECGKEILITEMIEKYSKDLTQATIERMANTLEVNGLYENHKQLILSCSIKSLNSYKLIRSYFNVYEKYSAHIEPKKILIKISKNNKVNSKMIIYFVERYLKLDNNEPVKFTNIISTLRADLVTKIYCNLRIFNLNRIGDKIDEIYGDLIKLKTENYMINNKFNDVFIRMIREAIGVAYYEDRNEIVIEMIEHFKLDNEYREQIISGYIRSLIENKNYLKVEGVINKFENDMTDIQRWTSHIEIGNLDLVKNEIIDIKDLDKLSQNEMKSLKSIYFKLAMFKEYLDLTTHNIREGDFKFQDLSRHFFSLYKLGKDEDCIEFYNYIYYKFNHNPQKRVIIALIGYDFSLSKEYINDIELAIMMDSNGYNIPLFASRMFLNMERIDLSFYFFRYALKNGQTEREVLKLGKEIQNILKDLDLNPVEMTNHKIMAEPKYIDVEVIRRVISVLQTRKSSERKVNGRVALQSHTLDIGGAERQASYLLNLLDSKVIENSSYTLVTHKIPNKSQIKKTYYADIDVDNTSIKEYIKASKNIKIDAEINRIIRHLNPLKERRMVSMANIFLKGEFEIIHTWQDYCNIYGSLAALISGSGRIIMSARTLPPPEKGKLASRQGRSYRECYQLLLETKEIILTHNSDFGRESYQEWLGGSLDKHRTIHNGLNILKFSNIDEENVIIRDNLQITKNEIVIGYIGRFTTDKRPWLFLKVIESILGDGLTEKSKDLDEWYMKNEGGNISLSEFEKPNWSKIGDIKVIMVGDGPQFENAKKIVDGSEIMKNKVHLVGFSGNVGGYLNEFDVLMLTSKVEGLPNVLIEAQSCSVPVVSTNAGGSRECFIEGETGLLSNHGNISELEYLLSKALDIKFRKNVKKIALKFIEKRFGEKTYSKNINDLYWRY